MGCSSHHCLRTFLMDHLPDWMHSWGIIHHLLLETPAHIQCLPQTYWEADASDCPQCMTSMIIQPLWGPVATSIRWSSEKIPQIFQVVASGKYTVLLLYY